MSTLLPGWSNRDRGQELSEGALKVFYVDDSSGDDTLPEAALRSERCPHSLDAMLKAILQKSCPSPSSQST